MKTTLKKPFVGIFLLSAMLMLTSCAVVIVGAIGAAGISSIDKKDAKSPDADNNNPSNKTKNKTKNKALELVPPNEAKPQVLGTTTDKKDESALSQPQDAPAEVAMTDKSSSAVIDQPSAQNPITEGQPRQAMNNTSLENLTAHPWKLIAVRGLKDFNLKATESIFVFTKEFKLHAFVTCNDLAGRYKSNDTGKFLLSRLKSTNKSCSASRQPEVLIGSMLLSADEFVINDQVLTLGYQGKANLAFEPSVGKIQVQEIKKPSQRKAEPKK